MKKKSNLICLISSLSLFHLLIACFISDVNAQNRSCLLVDKSGSMLGFLKAESNGYPSVLDELIDHIIQYSNSVNSAPLDIYEFSSCRKEILTSIPTGMPIDPACYGQETKIDQALLEVFEKNYSLVFILTDNVQDEHHSSISGTEMGRITHLYEHFRSPRVSQVLIIPAILPFNDWIYLPAEDFSEKDPELIRNLVENNTLCNDCNIGKIAFYERYTRIKWEGPRGLMIYCITFDGKANEEARSISESLASGLNTKAILTKPLGNSVINMEPANLSNGTVKYKETEFKEPTLFLYPSDDGYIAYGEARKKTGLGLDYYEGIFHVKFTSPFDYFKLNTSADVEGSEINLSVQSFGNWEAIGFREFQAQPQILPPKIIGQVIEPDAYSRIYQITIKIPCDSLKLKYWPLSEFFHVAFHDCGWVTGKLKLDMQIPAHSVQLSSRIFDSYFTRELTGFDRIFSSHDLVKFLTDQNINLSTLVSIESQEK